MLQMSLSAPVERPSPQWLRAFARRLIQLHPGLLTPAAMDQALMAHAATWLFEPDEAAELWLATLKQTRLIGDRHHLRGRNSD